MEVKSSVSLLEANGVNTQVVFAAQEFLRKQFIANPSYSFNNADIMINHSIQVMDVAVDIGSQIPECDLLVVSLGALFHDIGKVAKVSPEILKDKHSEYNWVIASEFLNGIVLTPEQTEKLKNILYERPETLKSCVEQQAVKDGDRISFMKDYVLQKALYDWAEGIHTGTGILELQKKLNNVTSLVFERSKELAKEPYENMRNKWGLNNTTQ